MNEAVVGSHLAMEPVSLVQKIIATRVYPIC